MTIEIYLHRQSDPTWIRQEKDVSHKRDCKQKHHYYANLASDVFVHDEEDCRCGDLHFGALSAQGHRRGHHFFDHLCIGTATELGHAWRVCNRAGIVIIIP